MALIKYNNVGIKAISACVPPQISSNYDLHSIVSQETIDRLVQSIGIEEKRVVEDDVCTSDLCFKAAKRLIDENDIDPTSIDMLIFVSLTPDYITPATSSILQHRLGLSTSTLCMDVSIACSGYIYALSMAFAYASMSGIDRVLVLVGETLSKVTNPLDRVNSPLFGDAGTATLIASGDYGESLFLLTGDGQGEDAVKIPHGGYRYPLTVDSLMNKEREDGNIRRDVDFRMDGMTTFNVAISAIPKHIKRMMLEAQITADDINYLVPHQGNRFMIDFIVKRLKFDFEKVPYCLKNYGNVSSASIPLTIVTELQNCLDGEKKVLLSAIGAGWSFGTTFMTTRDIKISRIFDY